MLAEKSLEGLVIDGQYRVEEVLSDNGVCQLLKVYDQVVYEHKLLKLGNPEYVIDKDAFLEKGERVKLLFHPHILEIIDVGACDIGPYVTYEYSVGKRFDEAIFVGEMGAKNQALLHNLLMQFCDALEVAHQLPIAHKGLRPSNVLIYDVLEHKDYIRIMDFCAGDLFPDRNRIQLMRGKWALLYTAPEVCLGSEPDLRSDIYSFGCLFYEALACQPFLNSEVLRHYGVKNHTVQDALPGWVAKPLGEILARCLESDPEKRYASATELKADIMVIM